MTSLHYNSSEVDKADKIMLTFTCRFSQNNTIKSIIVNVIKIFIFKNKMAVLGTQNNVSYIITFFEKGSVVVI